MDGSGKGETINVLYEWMDPRFLSTLTLTVVPGTSLAKLQAQGRFKRYLGWTAICSFCFLLHVTAGILAGGALGVGVLVLEREAGLVVVEGGLLPVALAVAVGALRAQRALVGVVLAMAFHAGLRRLAPG